MTDPITIEKKEYSEGGCNLCGLKDPDETLRHIQFWTMPNSGVTVRLCGEHQRLLVRTILLDMPSPLPHPEAGMTYHAVELLDWLGFSDERPRERRWAEGLDPIRPTKNQGGTRRGS